MRYQQTLEIHQRLETVLRLIRTGKYSTPALAETVGVSIPTISRIVAALRVQGHEIRAERHDGGWRCQASRYAPLRVNDAGVERDGVSEDTLRWRRRRHSKPRTRAVTILRDARR